MRYTGPKCRLCRREGEKLFLKGERCFSPKCPLERKGAVVPGQHGPRRRRKRVSDFGLQLREKQKAKRIYGVAESQFKKYVKRAVSKKKGADLRVVQRLESRLDNLVFRGGLASSRSSARQIVSHGFCLVDGRKVDIPSYRVKPDQVVSLTPKGLKLTEVKKALAAKPSVPKWLAKKAASVKIKRLPDKEEAGGEFDAKLIIEFYSR